MLILGIEPSCDESGISPYQSERGLLTRALHTHTGEGLAAPAARFQGGSESGSALLCAYGNRGYKSIR